MNLLLPKTARNLLITTCCCSVACAPGLMKKQQAFDFSHVGSIDLQITASEPSVLTTELKQLVGKNLVAWDYPIGSKDGQSFSHVLKATVVAIEHGNTPTGFSFSAGNSDPRAMDFQKTNVLPISCALTSMAHPEQSDELSMGFTASQTDRRAFANDKLADHISTVCFNLLREIHWPEPKQKSESAPIKPGWIPEIRIESKAAPVPVEKQNSLEETPAADSEPRKEIIIHNQGSPVILHFGHERR